MKRIRPALVCLALAATLAACSFPIPINALTLTATAGNAYETASTPLAETSIGTTTAAGDLPSSTLTVASQVPTPTSTLTPVPSVTQVPTPTTICNRALPGSPIDISIPDDTIMAPGQVFSKTWRLQNAGSCAWNTRYAVVYFSGDALGASRTNLFPGPVQPGQTVDLTVDMVAPPDSGTYQGNWELSDPQGTLFGLGPDGNASFWVRIIVVAPATLTPTLVVTVTPTSTPAVYVNGLSNLKPDDTLDLDTNKINVDSNDDLLYTLETDKTHRLSPKNGAKIAVFGQSLPSFLDCSQTSLHTGPILLDTLSQGAYFCYTTNIGLPGWARLVALNAQDHTLTLEILTWTIP